MLSLTAWRITMQCFLSKTFSAALTLFWLLDQVPGFFCFNIIPRYVDISHSWHWISNINNYPICIPLLKNAIAINLKMSIILLALTSVAVLFVIFNTWISDTSSTKDPCIVVSLCKRFASSSCIFRRLAVTSIINWVRSASISAFSVRITPPNSWSSRPVLQWNYWICPDQEAKLWNTINLLSPCIVTVKSIMDVRAEISGV